MKALPLMADPRVDMYNQRRRRAACNASSHVDKEDGKPPEQSGQLGRVRNPVKRSRLQNFHQGPSHMSAHLTLKNRITREVAVIAKGAHAAF